jgi:ER-derived vesicles protein
MHNQVARTVISEQMDRLQQLSYKTEHCFNRLASPIQPYLSHIGRFLLVVTFFEDAFRICVQYPEQFDYMKNFRHFPALLAHLFLVFCVGAMVFGSILALSRQKMNLSCGLLASVVLIQSLGYGILFNFSFMMRNFSLIGGVLLLLVESIEYNRKASGRESSSILFRGLPALTDSESEKSTYISLIGRILLIFLFGSLIYSSNSAEHESTSVLTTTLKGVYFVPGSVACLMVAIGFKARYSAMLLVAVLSIANMFVNQWWKHGRNSPERDFLRYDFFQTLSIIGGFMLLLNTGPGELSFDKKRKEF